MNKLPMPKRVAVVHQLIEGASIRSTVRLTGAAKNTVSKLLLSVGGACADYLDGKMRGLTCQRLQVDEIWSFCGKKEKHVPDERKGEYGIGDVWTFTAIDAETKIVPSFMVAKRTPEW